MSEGVLLTFPGIKVQVMSYDQAREVELSIGAFPENISFSPCSMKLAVASYLMALEALQLVDPTNPLLEAAQVP